MIPLQFRNRFKRIFTVFLLLPVFVAAQQPGPFIRAEIKPKSKVIIGETVVLEVDILVPTWFSKAPQFPVINVENAITLPPERSMNLTEQIDSESYAGIRREYKIIPQLPGTYYVPSVTVGFYYALENARPSALTTLKTRPFTFTAELPPEARGLSYFIAASRMTASQKRSPQTDTLRVGDALERTLTFKVYDALAMVIPPLAFDSIPGLAVYPHSPIVEDFGGERGSQRIGQRIESVTYIVQDSGRYTLPAVEFSWWNIHRKRLQTARVPAIRFYAKKAPEQAALFPVEQDTLTAEGEAADELDYTKMTILLLSATLILMLFYRLTRRYAPEFKRRYSDYKHQWQESEKACFACLRKACMHNRPRETVQRLLDWTGKIGLHSGLNALFAESADERLVREIQNLMGQVYGKDASKTTWQGRRLYAALKRFRKSYLKKTAGMRRSYLPPLNPL